MKLKSLLNTIKDQSAKIQINLQYADDIAIDGVKIYWHYSIGFVPDYLLNGVVIELFASDDIYFITIKA
jgi:hypothetical protein